MAGRAPLYVRREDVPPVVVERERAVFLAQVVDKPDNIKEKIVEGKLDAYFGEICLLEQPYVRDEKGKKKVSELVNDAVAKLKENITVSRFVRFQVGESAIVTGDRSDPHEDGAAAPSDS